MAVTATLQLPAQPTSGEVVISPLAGNGYTAPHSETRVRVNLSGAVGGGSALITVFWDPRWVSIISWCALAIDSLGADQLAQFDYTIAANLGMGCALDVKASGLSGVDGIVTWCPPPQLSSVPTIGATQPNLRVATGNVDGDVYQLFLVLLNFKKDVLQRVPMSRLVQSLPRGTSFT